MTIKNKILSITAYCGVFPYDKLITYYGKKNRSCLFKVVSELINDKLISKNEVSIETKSPNHKVSLSTKKLKELTETNKADVQKYLTELYKTTIPNITNKKTITKLVLRSSKKTKDLLENLYPGAYTDYILTHANALRKDMSTNLRLYRTAEVMVMLDLAGVNILPYTKPNLQNKERLESSCAYRSVEVKELTGKSVTKTATQFHAMMFNKEHSYTIYSLGEYLMEWDSSRQCKASSLQKELSHNLLGSDNITYDAIVISPNPNHASKIAKGSILNSGSGANTNKNAKTYIKADSTFDNFHYVPADLNGVAQISIMNIEHYQEDFLKAMFPNDKITILPCDADILTRKGDKEVYILYGYDLNLTRISRLALYASQNKGNYEVLCFSWQKPIIESISTKITPNCTLPDEAVLDFYEIDTEYIKKPKRKEQTNDEQ